ncbi:MAG: HlyD family efflux transporter periplasmic adaptor subunit [Clostridia bacterium]
MTKKKKNVALYIIIAVLVLIILAIVFLPTLLTKNAVKYDAVNVTSGDVYRYVTGTSNAIVKEQQVAMSLSNGEVKEIKFAEGDFVKKDQTILVVGSIYYKANFDGYVTFIDVEKGDKVTQGDPLFTVTDNSEFKTVLSVNEASYHFLKKGNTATITFNAIPNTQFNGVLTKIASDGKITNGATLFDVYVEIDKNDKFDMIRNNMTCEVKIVADQRNDVLVIPVKALTYNGDKPCVLVKDGNDYKKVEIELGMSDGIIVEVVGGLTLDQTIYYTKDDSSRMAQMMEMWGM